MSFDNERPSHSVTIQTLDAISTDAVPVQYQPAWADKKKSAIDRGRRRRTLVDQPKQLFELGQAPSRRFGSAGVFAEQKATASL
jgi:hypothetical protein